MASTRRGSASATTVDTVTVAGSSATILSQQDNPAASTINVASGAAIALPTGTSGTIGPTTV